MVRLAEANIESFLSYFNEPEDYLNVTTDSTITFEQVVDFMRRLKDARELNTKTSPITPTSESQKDKSL